MFTYDQPLIAPQSIGAVNFATPTAAVTVPVKVQLQKRTLDMAAILGLLGVVTTAGTGTISIGDGTTVARFGTFVLTPGLAVGAAVTGTLTLTPAGQHVGVNNTAPTASQNITLTFSGTAALSGVTVFVARFN